MDQFLVAAGVVLRWDQDQPWARRNRLRPRWLAESAQDAEDRDVSCENAKAKRSDNSEAEDDRHQERNHGRKSFRVTSAEADYFVSTRSNRRRSSLVAGET